jgi:hypothetical protein
LAGKSIVFPSLSISASAVITDPLDNRTQRERERLEREKERERVSQRERV